jgi:hypothetical protein
MQKQKCCPDECPKEGDVFVCQDCKHTVLVVRGCECDDSECVALACCGKAMAKAN